MENKPTVSFLNLPSAIVIAGAIIAIAIIWVKSPTTTPVAQNTDDQVRQVNLTPITSADHIKGNPNAPIKIVEYSDTSCPFCKTFSSTMNRVMDQYGPDGKVAWVYRHFPLDKPNVDGSILHPNAGYEAQAMECAASVGSNEKFWAFEKRLYEVTPSVTSSSPNGLDRKQLPEIAKYVGINVTNFNECLSGDRFKGEVEADYTSGVNAGVSGTPTNFIVLSSAVNAEAVNFINNALIQYKVPKDLLYVSDDKKMIVMSGAMPETLIKGLLDTLIGK